MKTVQSYSEALKRRELEGAPLLRERGEVLVLAERFLWPYAVMGAMFIVLGSAMSFAWLAMLATCIERMIRGSHGTASSAR